MGYINELRLRVGKLPLVMVGAGVLVFDARGRVLLLRRSDNGCWGVPGGMTEPGETVEDTARRETREETGLEVSGLSLFGVFSGPELHYRYPNGDEVHNVSVVYTAGHVAGSVRLAPEEHAEFGYFDLHALPAAISPPVMPVLRELARRGPGGRHRPRGTREGG